MGACTLNTTKNRPSPTALAVPVNNRKRRPWKPGYGQPGMGCVVRVACRSACFWARALVNGGEKAEGSAEPNRTRGGKQSWGTEGPGMGLWGRRPEAGRWRRPSGGSGRRKELRAALRAFLAHAAVTEEEALAVHFEDVHMVGEAVE